MGLTNLQCMISKETISENDLVVTFVLEPNSDDGSVPCLLEPATSLGHHYKLNSLPIIGVYGGYGQNHAAPGQEGVISLVKAFYDFDYSVDMSTDYAHSGKRLKRGGPTKEYGESNTFELVVLKSVYDLVVNSTNSDDISEQLKDKKLKEAFSGAIDDQLLSALVNYEDNGEIKDAATFLKGFCNLGLSLKPTPYIAAQNAITDHELREKLHATLLGQTSEIPNNSDSPEEFCLLSRESIKEGSVVYLLPLMSNESTKCKRPLDEYEDHYVRARFTPISSPVKCKYTKGGLSLLEPLGSVSRFVLAKILGLGSEAQDEEIFNGIIAKNKLKRDSQSMGLFSCEYQSDYVLFSEKAYEIIKNTDVESITSRLNADAAVFKSSARTLTDLPLGKCKSLDELISVVSESGVFHGDSLKHAMRYLEIHKSILTFDPDFFRFLVNGLYKLIPPADNEVNKANLFVEQIFKDENPLSFFHQQVVSDCVNVIKTNPDSLGGKSNYNEFVDVFVNDLVESMEAVVKVFSALNKAAITLVPFDKYSGELSVSEHQILINKIHAQGYTHCKTKIANQEV